MKNFKLLLFGGFRLLTSQGDTLTLASRKSRALLAWLALNPDQQHPREKLAAILWPDSDEAQGRHSLRQALAELRKVLVDDTGPLSATKEWILLDSKQIDVDIQQFNACIAQGDSKALEQAIDLYKGEFLEGCNPHSDSFDEWLAVYRTDFSIKAAAILEQRQLECLEQHEYELACQYAVRLLNLDPLREQAYRILMQSHASLGNQATAIRWYKRCQTVLQRELGIAPDRLTQTLYAKLLADQKPSETTNPQTINARSTACVYPLSKKAQPLLSSQQRVLYLVETAIDSIFEHIGGQSFLLRGEQTIEKTHLVKDIIALADFHGIAHCHRQVPDFANTLDGIMIRELLDGSSHCLAKQPVLLLVEDIHLATMNTLKLLASLIALVGNGNSMLLVMTSCFEGEPLDPVWRGVMRGAPLTVIDL